MQSIFSRRARCETGLCLISQEGMTVSKGKVKTRDQSAIVATYGHGLDNKGMRTGVLKQEVYLHLSLITPFQDIRR